LSACARRIRNHHQGKASTDRMSAAVVVVLGANRQGRLVTDSFASLGHHVGNLEPSRLGGDLRASSSAKAPLGRGYCGPVNRSRTHCLTQHLIGTRPNEPGKYRPGCLSYQPVSNHCSPFSYSALPLHNSSDPVRCRPDGRYSSTSARLDLALECGLFARTRLVDIHRENDLDQLT
jgi:hypothetical protein